MLRPSLRRFPVIRALVFLLSSVFLAAQPTTVGGSGVTVVGGAGITQVGQTAAPANNVTVIQSSFQNANGAAIIIPQLSSVTNGNDIVICAVGLGSNSFSSTAAAKSSGTATIGTITQRVHHDAASSADNATSIWDVHITGSGSLEITVTPASSNFLIATMTEVHNLNASPFDNANINAGTSAGATSGSISTSALGIIFYVSGESNTATDFTRLFSGTANVFSVDTGSSSYTGIIQYLITSGNTNTMTDSGWPGSTIQWNVAFSAYKTN